MALSPTESNIEALHCPSDQSSNNDPINSVQSFRYFRGNYVCKAGDFPCETVLSDAGQSHNPKELKHVRDLCKRQLLGL